MDTKPVRTSFVSQAVYILDEWKCCFGQGLWQLFSNPDAGRKVYLKVFVCHLPFQKTFTILNCPLKSNIKIKQMIEMVKIIWNFSK